MRLTRKTRRKREDLQVGGCNERLQKARLYSTLLGAFLTLAVLFAASNFSFALRSQFTAISTPDGTRDHPDLLAPSTEVQQQQSTHSKITTNNSTTKLTLEVPNLFNYSADVVQNLSTAFQYWSREANWQFIRNIGGVHQRNMNTADLTTTNDITNDTFHQHDWCIPQTKKYFRTRQFRDKPVVGLIFSKSPKSASSTGAAISIQVAKNVAMRQNYSLPCASNYSHSFAFRKSARRRIFPSIAFTHVRHPAKLAMSMFYHFGVARMGMNISDDKIMNFAESLRGTQLGYIGGSNAYKHDSIQIQILKVYDFVAVVERMEESLVAMKLLWHLEHEDIIVLNSKVAGSYSPHVGRCEKIPKSELTPVLKEYFETNFTQQNIDYLFYAVVNRTLDRTIEETIGRNLFEKELHIHQQLKALAESDCPSEQYAPCTSTGRLRRDANCFYADMGCGHECVQQSVIRHKAAVADIEED